MPHRVEHTEDEWREILGDDKYRILRRKGTEPAFTGRYWDHKAEGLYRCAACGTPLFSSETKYESGTGWPSFYAPVDPENVATEDDDTFGMHRVEVLCAACGSHLGHVFDDGPKPTGQRYCVNSASLQFEPQRSSDYPE